MGENPIAKRILAAISLSGVRTQGRLAALLGISPQMVHEIVTSKKPLSVRVALRLEAVLGERLPPVERLLKEQLPWQVARIRAKEEKAAKKVR